MSINIGDKNKIKNSNIINDSITIEKKEKQTFSKKHPIIVTLILTFMVGFIFLFSFWNKIILFIENLF